MNRRFVALGVAVAVLAGVWFVVGFQPAQSRLGEVRADVERTTQEVAGLQDRLAKLQALANSEGEVRERAEALAAALPGDPALPDLIRFVEDAAAQAGISFVSVTPGLPAAPANAGSVAAEEGSVPATGVQAISVQITADGSFFALEEFVLRLERLHRAVRVDSFTLSSGGDVEGAPILSLQMSMQVFMAPAGAPAADGAPGTES